jgi:hypothetical protein
MFNILHYTYLRLGDAHRFGPPPVRKGRMGITTPRDGPWSAIWKTGDGYEAGNRKAGRPGFAATRPAANRA